MIESMSPRRITMAALLAVVAALILFLSPKLLEDVGGDEIAVIQSPVEGRLDFYTTPGMKWQGFGEVTKYKNRSTFEFMKDGKGVDGIEVRFNDGGHAVMYGSIQFKMPTDEKRLGLIYRSYRTQEQLQKQIIETVTVKSIYLSGTLMSSKESYAEKRNDLIHYVTDQVQHGIYRTRQVTTWVKDPVTGQEKQIIAAEIVMGKDGKPERQENSALEELGLEAFNFTINSMPYDAAVEAQIKQQQQITMDVQTSRAELLKAEQRALTVEQQGKADAAEAKWKQEVLKAQAVTRADQEKIVAETNAAREKAVGVTNAQRDKEVAETQAQQRLNVAEFDRKAAEQTKQQQILLGEGEAKRKELVLAADGALAQKLETYREVAALYANAIKGSNWVPSVVMGGAAGSSTGTGATDLINLLTAKTARDLSLDMSISGGARK